MHPVLPGQPHWHNHSERNLLNTQPGHHVIKMWTGGGVATAISPNLPAAQVVTVQTVASPTAPGKRDGGGVALSLAEPPEGEAPIPAPSTPRAVRIASSPQKQQQGKPLEEGVPAAGNIVSAASERPPPCVRDSVGKAKRQVLSFAPPHKGSSCDEPAVQTSPCKPVRDRKPVQQQQQQAIASFSTASTRSLQSSPGSSPKSPAWR